MHFDHSSAEQGKEEIDHLKMNRSINEIINQRLEVRISQKNTFLQTGIYLDHIKVWVSEYLCILA